MEGDGTLRRLSLDVGQINEAFVALGDPRAIARPETAAPDRTFIEMQTALVSVPAIGQALIGENDQANLTTWLKPGDQALMIAGKGLFSFKGSGYVRGGIFDRIVLVQDDLSVRFHDRDHKRLARSRQTVRRISPKKTCSAFRPTVVSMPPNPSAFSFWCSGQLARLRRFSPPLIWPTNCRRSICAVLPPRRRTAADIR